MCLGLWGPDAAMLSPPERGAGGWNASPADFRAASEGLQRHLELIERTWSEIRAGLWNLERNLELVCRA